MKKMTMLLLMFDRLPLAVQFTLLVTGVFVFFGVHNLLQEAIMQQSHRKYGIMLGATEVFGVCFFSYLERKCMVDNNKGLFQSSSSQPQQQQQQHSNNAVAMSNYVALTACLLGSSALSNMALNYINFPTKVVFRSSKLIPTMLIASLMHRKIFSRVEYLCAVAISLGLCLFAAADWELSTPLSFHPIGIVLVSLSVCADAILPNAQERLFRMGASRLEVTFNTNIFALMAYSFYTYASGDLQGTWHLIQNDQRLAVYYFVYIVVAYLAILVHMNVVKRFGGVAAVLVATARKGMTLVLSFLLFPKAFSWFYPVGATLVLGGLLMASLYKAKNNNTVPGNNLPRGTKSQQQQQQPPPPPHRNDLEIGRVPIIKAHRSDLEGSDSNSNEGK